jgi:phytoene desaturase
LKKSPSDLLGYENFLKYSKKVFDEGYTKLAHVPFLSLWSMIRVSPQLAKLSAHRSVYRTVSKYISDPHLRQAFSFHSLLVGGNPFKTSSIYTLIHFLERNWGVYFPKGGTGSLVNGLLQYFKDLGGEIELNAEIAEILTQDGKTIGVKTQKDKIHPCSIVVSNADVMHTYADLLKKEERVSSTRKRFMKMKYSMSLFLIYFGTKKQYPELAHHNVMFGPRYRELLQDIFENGNLSDDFSLYLHRPTASDPSLAPPGSDCFYVLSPVPHLGKYKGNWEIEGPKYAQRILQYLDQRYIPGLLENLVYQKIFTPVDFKTELNSHLGAAFSFEPLLTQSAYFRAHNRDKDLKGMYFVGAGTHPGAGVPGVINSGKATANTILTDFESAGFTSHA